LVFRRTQRLVGTTIIQYQLEGFLHNGICVNAFFDDASFSIGYEEEAVIPEPSTLFLLSAGIIGLIGFTRKLKK
jgi:hypothetical protein